MWTPLAVMAAVEPVAVELGQVNTQVEILLYEAHLRDGLTPFEAVPPADDA